MTQKIKFNYENRTMTVELFEKNSTCAWVKIFNKQTGDTVTGVITGTEIARIIETKRIGDK